MCVCVCVEPLPTHRIQNILTCPPPNASYKSVKKIIDFCEKGRSNRTVAAVFHFVYLTQTRIGSEYVIRNKAFILANLMQGRIVIVKIIRVQLLIRLSKY